MSLSLPLPPTRASRSAVLGVLGVLLLGSLVAAAGAGQLEIPASEVIGSVLHRVGLDLGSRRAIPRGGDAVQVRFPRLAMAVLVGASLGAAGSLMQGVFGNPLAEPGVVGVSAGAALAAAGVIVFDLAFLGQWTIAVAAFLGGLVTTVAVYLLAPPRPHRGGDAGADRHRDQRVPVAGGRPWRS